MTNDYFLGIDGGGTKCKARLEDAHGNLLAEAIAGPANAARDLIGTQQSILEASNKVIADSGIAGLTEAHINACLGLAGVNIPDVMQEMQAWQAPFAKTIITTDLYIACAGAHKLQDGAIIITGTGSSGAAISDGQYSELGGHGLVVGDQGSGAWLGQQAITHTLLTLDKLRPSCCLADRVMEKLGCQNGHEIVSQCLVAKPAYYARLAPLVLELASNGENCARDIVQQGAAYISQLARQLLAERPGRLSMIGGIAEPLRGWLEKDVRQSLSPALASPEEGAVLYLRSQLEG